MVMDGSSIKHHYELGQSSFLEPFSWANTKQKGNTLSETNFLASLSGKFSEMFEENMVQALDNF